MNLDPRTLLFSLILTYGLSVLSMFFAASSQAGSRTRDGMGKWTAALFLLAMAWVLIAARGKIPDIFSVIIPNGFMAAAYALMLAAIHEFQRRRAPRWQYLVPVALTLLMVTVLLADIRARFIGDFFIYGFQMVLIARALLSERKNSAGRAWRLLLGGVAMIMLVLVSRAYVALTGHVEFAQPQNTLALHPVQVIAYIAIMATAVLGSIGFVLMVKERSDSEVMHLAMTDSLTQIPNRRALMKSAEQALARRSGLPVSILMIDLDHFKPINDTYGHQTGDEVLCQVVGRLNGRLRQHDVLGRYGGEEFCVVAPDSDAKGVLALAESLRERIAATPFATSHGEISASVSIGITTCEANAMCKLDEILAQADAALYTAKQAGRNRVVCFSSMQQSQQPKYA
jgi:diguanylate cyclase (GGDEF)-like protein